MAEMVTLSGNLTSVAGQLKSGIEHLLEFLKRESGFATDIVSELEEMVLFLETLDLIQDTLSEARLVESLRNTINRIRDIFDQQAALFMRLDVKHMDQELRLPKFLVDCLRTLGPGITISSNKMKAWVSIAETDASIFRVDDVLNKLQECRIVYGVNESAVQSIFVNKQYDQAVLIAQGVSPKPGKNGRVDYQVKVEDISRKPKLLEDGSASFKEIELFVYVQAGDVIAELVPAVQGENGYTVYQEPIFPSPVQEATLPKLPYTKLTPDKQRLIATEDCCVTKQNNQIILNPALKISGKVSNETGNINSRVSVIVMEDVLTGFSVTSDQTISVQGVVEGANISSKESIILKGGVHGKHKALLQANGDIRSAIISHAVANAMGQVVVDTQIINSTVYAVGSISVMKDPGEIIGGELDANGDVVANSIGSEMGIHTLIRMGGRKQGLKSMLDETMSNIAEQEKIIDQCNQVLFSLNEQYLQQMISKEEFEEIKERTQEMLKSAREILESLQDEADGIHLQIESLPNEIHTVRARKTFYPGVVIQINGVELKIEEATGPATVIKEGNQLQIYPYKELSSVQ